ncbi:hypothetical protein LTR36_001690 [Oleoguttula mirabilis]|uniref:Uncharacterized protein n=1 Tax=Oleoguttula mirabilis TaxID=1507867 RepID=A0AAV9JQZ6_9PEZI|nr:hypothetical protein LTR36_001690 [Oleoguttula mirabilis]
MLAIFTLIAAFATTLAAAQNSWWSSSSSSLSSSSSSASSTTSSASTYVQPYCPGQTQPSGRYSYNASNPFPISTYATVHNSSATTSTYIGNITSSGTVGPLSTGTGSIATAYNSTTAIGTGSYSTGLATHTASSPSTSTSAPLSSTGAASRHSLELVGALGGLSAFAVAAVLL